ncbi:hypothetical protein I79_007854 [Cricetulus griseus]|uniref:Uncharacterized protein n=1 Tax=Cricetulus griseus TaxID=10029 RepID=G3HBM0_CRIGR|nr:hypothetical protein I79_007854 [Cricetulus griseus]
MNTEDTKCSLPRFFQRPSGRSDSDLPTRRSSQRAHPTPPVLCEGPPALRRQSQAQSRLLTFFTSLLRVAFVSKLLG